MPTRGGGGERAVGWFRHGGCRRDDLEGGGGGGGVVDVEGRRERGGYEEGEVKETTERERRERAR